MTDDADHFPKRSCPSRLESEDVIQLGVVALLSLCVSVRHYTNVCPCMALCLPAQTQHANNDNTRKLSCTHAHALT